MKNLLFRIFTTCLAILILVGTVAAQSNLSSATITASADGLSAPETLPAGLTSITFENTAEAPLFTIFARLNDDVTMDDFMEALMGGPENAIPLVTLKGSPLVMPGASQTATFNLQTGTYVLLNPESEVPQMVNFVVEGDSPDTIEEPESDMTVVLVDFAFGMPVTIPSGEQTWQIQNSGEQWHEMAIIPVPDGTTMDDVMAMMMSMEESAAEGESEDMMMDLAAVWTPMGSGESAWVDVDLAPGTYVVSCFLPDLASEDGSVHLEHGMIQIITVADTLMYEDADGMFTLDYPAGLVVRPNLAAEAFGMPFPSVAFADSDQTIDQSVAAQVLDQGAWGIGTFFMPGVMFAEMGLPDDATLLDKAIAFAAPESDNAEGATMGETMEITLDDGTPAVQIEGPGETEDNFVIFFEVTDDVYVLVSLLTTVDGRTDEMVADLMTTVNSIQFTGTAEDLMAGLGG